MAVVEKKDGRFFCVYRDERGAQIWESFGRDGGAKEAAEERDLVIKLEKKRGEWKTTPHGSLTFAELAQQYIDNRYVELGSKTVEEILRTIAIYALELIGTKYVSQISMSDWTRIQARMVRNKLSPVTVNKYFQYMNKVFKWGEVNLPGQVKSNPWQKRQAM